MATVFDSFEQFHPKDRKAWRQWLHKNHKTSPGIWLVYYKAESGKPRMSYSDSAEEALCYGWIDSLPRKLDAERSMLAFTPRKHKSVWSDLNKERVARLIVGGLMQPAGLAAIEIARKNGSWDTLTESNKAAVSNELPKDLIKAFQGKTAALKNYKAFSPSIRKQFMYWINSAKTEETRNKRIAQTVLMIEANKKPGAQDFKL
jgi:uncharacterized protein YdeI (YjbR/CyaY-like superfamily)